VITRGRADQSGVSAAGEGAAFDDQEAGDAFGIQENKSSLFLQISLDNILRMRYIAAMEDTRMTTRERRENRLQLRLDWADSRKAKSAEAFKTADRAVEGIPLGQPVLVGHHSEGRHRAALAKCDSAMHRGVEHSRMAEHHASKADGIERQLATSIYSDDLDAESALEAKATAIDAERERGKQLNAMWKKEAKPGEEWTATILRLVEEKKITPEEGKDIARNFTYSWDKKPCPSYHLTNLSANARRLRGRIEEIRRRAARTAQAEKAPSGVLIVRNPDSNWCSVTFCEKPDREILDALRAAGYGWGGGSWSGYLDRLPSIVQQGVQP